MSQNLTGALLMVMAMLAFAIEDAFIKVLARDLPLGQILVCLGIGGAFVFALMCLRTRQPLLTRDALALAVVLRNLAELIGTLGFVTALALIPLATASAILQAAPLVVVTGAALFFGEHVGWRRWAAIVVGFVGVMLIVRPGLDGFDWQSLFAVQGMLGLAIRDLATRRVPRSISSFQLSLLAFSMLVPAGLILMMTSGEGYVAPTSRGWLLLLASVLVGALAYYAIVRAMRVGDISFVTPFRYTRILFALIIGLSIFGERPDMLTLVGASIVILSGLYTLWREQLMKSRAAA